MRKSKRSAREMLGLILGIVMILLGTLGGVVALPTLGSPHETPRPHFWAWLLLITPNAAVCALMCLPLPLGIWVTLLSLRKVRETD
jgi:hypothetical protein